MKVRTGGDEGGQLIGGAGFPPELLRAVFQAFDGAWAQVAPDTEARADAIETARLSLAEIVLSIAKAGLTDRDVMKTAAVNVFREKHRIARPF